MLVYIRSSFLIQDQHLVGTLEERFSDKNLSSIYDNCPVFAELEKMRQEQGLDRDAEDSSADSAAFRNGIGDVDAQLFGTANVEELRVSGVILPAPQVASTGSKEQESELFKSSGGASVMSKEEDERLRKMSASIEEHGLFSGSGGLGGEDAHFFPEIKDHVEHENPFAMTRCDQRVVPIGDSVPGRVHAVRRSSHALSGCPRDAHLHRSVGAFGAEVCALSPNKELSQPETEGAPENVGRRRLTGTPIIAAPCGEAQDANGDVGSDISMDRESAVSDDKARGAEGEEDLDLDGDTNMVDRKEPAGPVAGGIGVHADAPKKRTEEAEDVGNEGSPRKRNRVPLLAADGDVVGGSVGAGAGTAVVVERGLPNNYVLSPVVHTTGEPEASKGAGAQAILDLRQAPPVDHPDVVVASAVVVAATVATDAVLAAGEKDDTTVGAWERNSILGGPDIIRALTDPPRSESTRSTPMVSRSTTWTVTPPSSLAGDDSIRNRNPVDDTFDEYEAARSGLAGATRGRIRHDLHSPATRSTNTNKSGGLFARMGKAVVAPLRSVKDKFVGARRRGGLSHHDSSALNQHTSGERAAAGEAPDGGRRHQRWRLCSILPRGTDFVVKAHGPVVNETPPQKPGLYYGEKWQTYPEKDLEDVAEGSVRRLLVVFSFCVVESSFSLSTSQRSRNGCSIVVLGRPHTVVEESRRRWISGVIW